MSVQQEIEALRIELGCLADQVDKRLAERYRLWHPPGQRRTMYRRFRKSLGRLLRQLHLRPATAVEPWLAGLKHVKYSDQAKPLIIWAQDIEREQLRQACHRIEALLSSVPGWAPILVTDVADFAFFSRLGWLVEYLPSLDEPADNYLERKRQYLAWRYRDAVSLPVSVGSHPNIQPKDLLLD